MKRLWYLLIVCVCLLSATYGLQAAYITFHNEITEDTGTGFGNVLQTLVLQSSPDEWGSVTWNGAIDLKDGDAKTQSQTVTVADLTAKGFDGDDLIVILNLSQAGPNDALDLHSFTMRFYTSLDGSSFFDAVYDENDVQNTGSTLGLDSAGQGTGSAGYVFRITFEGTEAADFFANSAHRIGTLVDENNPIDNESNDGPDVFYMADADVNDVIPEPATLAVLLLTGSLALVARKKRQQT